MIEDAGFSVKSHYDLDAVMNRAAQEKKTAESKADIQIKTLKELRPQLN